MDFGELIITFLSFILFAGFIGFVMCIVSVVCFCKLFKKAGYEGWESIVPFYSMYVMYDIVYGQGLYFLLSFVPAIGWVFAAATLVKLAPVYGKSVGYGLGLLFVPIVFLPMLAFDKNSLYWGPSKKMMEAGSGNKYNGDDTDYRNFSYGGYQDGEQHQYGDFHNNVFRNNGFQSN